MTSRQRATAFAAIAVVSLVAIAVTLWRARVSMEPPVAVDAKAPPPAVAAVAPPPPFVVVRSLQGGESWGRLAVVPLASPEAPRFVAPLACLRVHVAAGRGICLATDDANGSRHLAQILDERFEPTATIPLTGPPSRARMSRDGRWAAVTVFEQGHSYADDSFSTRTTLIDAVTGTSLGDLEQFTVYRDGRVFRRVDFNFWGVTFAPEPGRFYATLAWGGRPYLVVGDVAARTVRVVAADVECPSLSPDGTRIAFKRRQPHGFEWRLWTMTLETLDATPVAGESRSIDDQVEWLDDGRLLYQFPDDSGNHVWVTSADGTGAPSRFVTDAWSPAVVR
jgi:WD40-like Beta Propeller Repeat